MFGFADLNVSIPVHASWFNFAKHRVDA